MTFIVFFHYVAAYKKALVALLGPVPGIFIGFLLGIVYAFSGIAIIQRMMIMFFVINIFNLLPFFPLDGGRFLHEALFSRNRYIELIFKILASLAMIASGLRKRSKICRENNRQLYVHELKVPLGGLCQPELNPAINSKLVSCLIY
jgi:Zn-dependent protease